MPTTPFSRPWSTPASSTILTPAGRRSPSSPPGRSNGPTCGRSQITVTFRSGWQWASIEGHAVLVGPDDPQPWLSRADLPSLLRAIFVAAGGRHDDWHEFDAVMARERRLAVLVDPIRVYGNPGASADVTGPLPSAPTSPTENEWETR